MRLETVIKIAEVQTKFLLKIISNIYFRECVVFLLMLHHINGFLLVNQQITVYTLDMESKRLEQFYIDLK